LKFGVLVFVEGGKPENPEKNPLSKDENYQQTQPTYATGPELNPGHIGGRRALSPLRHPCSPKEQRWRSGESRKKSSDRSSSSLLFFLIRLFGTSTKNILFEERSQLFVLKFATFSRKTLPV